MKINHKAYGRDVIVTALMDPAQVQYGEASEESRIYPLDFNRSPNPYRGHRGIDTVGEATQPITAMIHGVVTDVTTPSETPSSGNTVWISNGTTAVGYAHFSRVCVAKGDKVTPSTIVGYEGATGNVSGKHLHTWIKINGQFADPLLYVSGRKLIPGEPAETYPDTDEYERDLDSPIPYRTLTDINVRQSPGTDKQVVGTMGAGTELTVDRWCELPNGQIWARLQGRPWHWLCLFDGAEWLVDGPHIPGTMHRVSPPKVYLTTDDIQGYTRPGWAGAYDDVLDVGTAVVITDRYNDEAGNYFGRSDTGIWYLLRSARDGWTVKGGYDVTARYELLLDEGTDAKAGDYYEMMQLRSNLGQGHVYHGAMRLA